MLVGAMQLRPPYVFGLFLATLCLLLLSVQADELCFGSSAGTQATTLPAFASEESSSQMQTTIARRVDHPRKVASDGLDYAWVWKDARLLSSFALGVAFVQFLEWMKGPEDRTSGGRCRPDLKLYPFVL
mmetsp:Transcript_33553/g.50728  ORF Transcript_33553/g.50728 Transcript_33553/m.50728 type:complete len:129 (-) Transcript_33553:25-411(-)|eukprot:CAMPEP_0206473514 /NCGR_PEP_ID=MMETSP0324_2-20121206/32906_1 /ASSEMBLY_ACC=CAM_ASM_000836 /TAXON_ID=2866 /ORGANISM="Crypthecodinium cohnii, Strain Seligo" /LENGTH=128 /DNA_ID=CAMNT_0053948449 /DNA_START=412 /DNA_END=798 /DNA_ORIENTATION=+